jgi:elongation factor Ts
MCRCARKRAAYLRKQMDVNANLVRELRDKTGAGVMDCKKALAESEGDLEHAARWLREKGIAQAARRAGRVASEGSVGAYIHAGGKLGVLVEVNCESDFVAKTPEFQTLVKEIAMQIAAQNPRCVSREQLAPEIIEQERQIYASQSAGKPEQVVAKIVEGKLERFYREVVLEEQAWVRDPNRTIRELLGEYTGKLGEKIEIRRFNRFQLGENLDGKAG